MDPNEGSDHVELGHREGSERTSKGGRVPASGCVLGGLKASGIGQGRGSFGALCHGNNRALELTA